MSCELESATASPARLLMDHNFENLTWALARQSGYMVRQRAGTTFLPEGYSDPGSEEKSPMSQLKTHPAEHIDRVLLESDRQ
jgi:hypothetical protein